MEVNDDIGAMLQFPKIIGRQAAIIKEQTVFSLLLNGIGTFFSAGNANYLTGANSVLSASALGTAAKALREMKDSSGEMLLQVPRAVVCPPALEEAALTLYRNTTVGAGATLNDGSTLLDGNIPMGRYTPAVGAYMGTAGGLTNGSDTGWILIGNPADVAAIEIGYLNGESLPSSGRHGKTRTHPACNSWPSLISAWRWPTPAPPSTPMDTHNPGVADRRHTPIPQPAF